VDECDVGKTLRRIGNHEGLTADTKGTKTRSK